MDGQLALGQGSSASATLWILRWSDEDLYAFRDANLQILIWNQSFFMPRFEHFIDFQHDWEHFAHIYTLFKDFFGKTEWHLCFALIGLQVILWSCNGEVDDINGILTDFIS